MAITAEQAAQLASTYQTGDTAGLQGLVNQMGVTQSDVAQYFPGFDVSTAGVTLPGASQSLTSQPISKEPTFGYSFTGPEAATQQQALDLFQTYATGYNPQFSGIDFWTNKIKELGLEGAKQQFLNPLDPNAPRLATMMSDPEWRALNPEYQNFLSQLPSISDATTGQTQDRTTADTYKDYRTYLDFLKGTSGMGYKDIVDYINANVQDPVKIAQAAAQFGIDPSEILAAKKAVGGQDIPTLQAIQDYLAQGTAGFAPRFQEMLGTTLGSSEEQQQLEQILQQQTNNPNASLADFYNPTKFSGMSLENIQTELRNSPVNKLQEALRLSKIAKTFLGYTDEQASELVKKAYKGEIKAGTPEAEMYNTLLDKNNIVGPDYERLLTYAATSNPDAPVFKDDPMLLLAYTPLDKKTGVTGQYGYYNNAPILNANFALDKLGDKNQTSLNLSGGTDFGWTTSSKYVGEIKRGPALLGINFNNRDDIEKAIALEQNIQNNKAFGTESGYVIVNPDETYTYVSAPQSENAREPYDPYGANTLKKLNDAAVELKLDPSQYKSAGDLFDAIEAKTNNLVQVTGRAIDWDPEAAKKAGITVTDGRRGGVNHAAVLYRQVGDKLIAIADPKSFAFDDPKKSGWLRQTFGDIAKIPFVAEIAALATGANPGVYAAMKGAQTALLGGKPEDVLKSVGIAYITPQVSKIVSGGVADLLQGAPKIVIDAASNAAANVAVNAGIAALTGKDVGDAIGNALKTSVVQTGAGQVPFIDTIPAQYRNIVTRAIADIALGSDIQKSIQKAITTYGLKSAKETSNEAKG